MKIPVNAIFSIYVILIAITSNDVKSQTPDYRVPGSQRRAVEGEPSNNNTTTRYRNSSSSQEKAEKEARYNKAHQDAIDAWYRKDYQEALRLYLLQQQLRDGPNVRADIDQCRQMIANAVDQAKIARDDLNARSYWSEGKLALERNDNSAALEKFKLAFATRPQIFNQQCVDFVAELESRIENLKKQKIQDQASANAIQQNLQQLAASLNASPVSTNMEFMSGNDQAVAASTGGADLPPRLNNAVTKAYATAAPMITERVRKGFEAVVMKDWKVAKAWFEDALFRDPANAGLKSFISLCDYSINTNTNTNVKTETKPQLNTAEKNMLNVWIARVQQGIRENNPVINAVSDMPSPAIDHLRAYVYGLSDVERDHLFFDMEPGDYGSEFLFLMQTAPSLKPKKPVPPKGVYKSSKDKIQN